MWTDGMAYVRTCASRTAEWRGMNRRKGVESKEGMEEMPLLYTLYSVEFQRNVAFLFARTVAAIQFINGYSVATHSVLLVW